MSGITAQQAADKAAELLAQAALAIPEQAATLVQVADAWTRLYIALTGPRPVSAAYAEALATELDSAALNALPGAAIATCPARPCSWRTYWVTEAEAAEQQHRHVVEDHAGDPRPSPDYQQSTLRAMLNRPFVDRW
jgi:hypothetical protein